MACVIWWLCGICDMVGVAGMIWWGVVYVIWWRCGMCDMVGVWSLGPLS